MSADCAARGNAETEFISRRPPPSSSKSLRTLVKPTNIFCQRIVKERLRTRRYERNDAASPLNGRGPQLLARSHVKYREPNSEATWATGPLGCPLFPLHNDWHGKVSRRERFGRENRLVVSDRPLRNVDAGRHPRKGGCNRLCDDWAGARRGNGSIGAILGQRHVNTLALLEVRVCGARQIVYLVFRCTPSDPYQESDEYKSHHCAVLLCMHSGCAIRSHGRRLSRI